MRRLCCVLAALGFVMLATGGPAAASILVHVDRSRQRMEVIVDGEPRYNWRVSTARRGYITPPGTYHPQRLAVRWYSKQIRQFADAAFDFLYRRLRHPRHLRDFRAGPAGVAWLRAPRSRQRRHPVRASRAEGSGNTTIVVH